MFNSPAFQHTPPSQRTLRLVQLTDLHLLAAATATYRGINPRQHFLSCLNLAVRLRPDALLLTGDLAEDCQEQTYIWLKQQLDDTGLAWRWLPGNHDAPEIMHNLKEVGFQAATQHWQLIGLNSHLALSTNGYLAQTELERLEQTLEEAKVNSQAVLVALHHHPVPVGSNWKDELGLNNSAAFKQILASNNQRKLVVFGHIHQEFFSQQTEAIYLGCPATSVEFTPKSADFAITPQVKPAVRFLRLSAGGKFSSRVLYGV